LDLFSVPPTQTSVEHDNWIEYHPLTTVFDGTPIEFEINGTGEDYIDLANSILYVQALDAAGPTNLFLHSLAGGHFVKWNTITASMNTYPYSVSSHVGNASQLR